MTALGPPRLSAAASVTLKVFAAAVVLAVTFIAATAWEQATEGHGAAGAATPIEGEAGSQGRGDGSSGSDGASISGTVTYPNGDPAVGLEVGLQTTGARSDDEASLRPAFTGSDGGYRFDDLAADCYVVVFRAPGGAAFDVGAASSERGTCLDPGQSDQTVSAVLSSGRPAEAFEVNVLHIGDHHSHLSPQELELNLGDQPALAARPAEPAAGAGTAVGDVTGSGDPTGPGVEVEVGGMARVAATMNERAEALGAESSTAESVIKIHTGDALSGTVMYTVFGGAADAAVLNDICFDLLGLGRQDLALGADELQVFFDFLGDGPCRPQVVSADLEAGQPSAPGDGPVAIRRFGDGLVGFVAVPAIVGEIDGSGQLSPAEAAGVTASTQARIDQLGGRGIANIVLISNIGLAGDLTLAAGLTDVDAIVGGGSHSLLGDFGALGLDVEGRYPQRAVNLDGDPVCIGHAWQYATVVGELRIGFDGRGGVSGCEGEAHLLLPTVEPDPATEATIDGYTRALDDLGGEALATVTEELCFTLVPSRTVGRLCSDDVIGDGSRRPADVQLLIAEAIRTHTGPVDVAIVNSGVVDRGLAPGPLLVEDTYRVLTGDHTVSHLQMTGAEIVATLEEALQSALSEGGSRRAYPYAAGLRWTYDRTRPEGTRVVDVEVRSDPADADAPWVAAEPDKTYTVATTGYLASGGHGYRTMAEVSADGRATRTFVEFSQALVDYIEDDLAGVVGPAARSADMADRMG